MKKIFILLFILSFSAKCDLGFNNEDEKLIIEEEQINESIVDTFDLELTNNEIIYEKNDISNDVGALSSFIYLIGDNSFTLYIFDTTQEEYKNINSTGIIVGKNDKVEKPVLINDEMVICFNNTFEERQEIENIFFNL